MTDIPKTVSIAELGPREGFQIETATIPTQRKVELIDALSRTGLREIEVTSFVSPKRVPSMADAEDVVAGITPQPGVRYTALWFNERGLERAHATGKLSLHGLLRIYASEAFLTKNLHRTPEQQIEQVHRDLTLNAKLGVTTEKAGIAAAFGCNFQGDIPPAKVVEIVGLALRLAEEHGVTIKIIGLADTMAWATPLTIKRVVGMVRDRFPELRVQLHLHDTRGMGIANAMAGLEMGVDMFDTSIAKLGGCPFASHGGAAGNLCTEDFAFLCQELGLETGLDLDALIECARLAEDVVGHSLPRRGDERRQFATAPLRRGRGALRWRVRWRGCGSLT